jgi:hypothetical protein
MGRFGKEAVRGPVKIEGLAERCILHLLLLAGDGVCSFCDLSVFLFFQGTYKYGEWENKVVVLVCVGILGMERNQ